MFVSIFGVPSDLTSFGVHAVRLLLTAAIGEHDLIYPATLQDLKNAWSQRTRKHIVSFNELPHGELISFLKQAEVPFIVFLRPGSEVADELINRRGLDPMDAIRTASISMSVLEEVARDPRALVIRSGARKKNSLRGFLRSVMMFAGTDLGPAGLTQLLTQISPGRAEPDLEELCLNSSGASSRRGSPAYHDISTEFLRNYDAILEGKPVRHMEWRPDHFLLMDDAGTRLNGFIELMGPARTLTYGPYFGLPRGSWSATIDITIRDNKSGNKLLVDVTTDIFLAKGRCKLPAEGDFRFDIAFDVIEPRHGVEIRLGIGEGAIEGALRLNRAVLTRSA